MKYLLIIITVTATLFAASRLNIASSKLETGYKTPIAVLKMAQKLGSKQ